MLSCVWNLRVFPEMHDGDSAPSCCAFTHWVAFEEAGLWETCLAPAWPQLSSRLPFGPRSKSTMCRHAESLQSCLTLCNPMDRSPPVEGLRRRLRPLLPDWISSSPRRLPLSAGSAPGLPRLGQGEADSMVKVQPEETPEHALQGEEGIWRPSPNPAPHGIRWASGSRRPLRTPGFTTQPGIPGAAARRASESRTTGLQG